jgi:hypothetical protein
VGSGAEEDAAVAGMVAEGVDAELVEDGVVPGKGGPSRFGRSGGLGHGRSALVASRLLSMVSKEFI